MPGTGRYWFDHKMRLQLKRPPVGAAFFMYDYQSS